MVRHQNITERDFIKMRCVWDWFTFIEMPLLLKKMDCSYLWLVQRLLTFVLLDHSPVFKTLDSSSPLKSLSPAFSVRHSTLHSDHSSCRGPELQKVFGFDLVWFRLSFGKCQDNCKFDNCHLYNFELVESAFNVHQSCIS